MTRSSSAAIEYLTDDLLTGCDVVNGELVGDHVI